MCLLTDKVDKAVIEEGDKLKVRTDCTKATTTATKITTKTETTTITATTLTLTVQASRGKQFCGVKVCTRW